MTDEQRFAFERDQMVRDQLEARGISAPDVLSAMRSVPRHLFVPGAHQHLAYHDRALPIGPGQTVSQPYIVALMLEKLALQPSDSVLEVGTGTGYQAALLSRIARDVFTMELDSELLVGSEKLLRELGCANVHFLAGNGFDGWPEYAPYDKIIVSAAPSEIPRELVRELKTGGLMVLPLGDELQELVLLHKTEQGLQSTELGAVHFVEMKE